MEFFIDLSKGSTTSPIFSTVTTNTEIKSFSFLALVCSIVRRIWSFYIKHRFVSLCTSISVSLTILTTILYMRLSLIKPTGFDVSPSIIGMFVLFRRHIRFIRLTKTLGSITVFSEPL